MSKDRLNETIISLPVRTNIDGTVYIDPDSPYSDEGYVPDFDYMQERIHELERERIHELEQYLIATGLDNYELTDEDKLYLGVDFSDDLQLGNITIPMREFHCTDLFELQKITRTVSKRQLVTDSTKFPAYSADTRNNGIVGYVDNPEFICDENNPVYITFGDHTRSFNIARKSFSVFETVKVLKPCIDSDEALLFLTTLWKKCIINLGYSRHWKVAKKAIITLPVQIDSQGNPVIDENHTYHPEGYIPDWDFMEKYIRATEKVVIRNAVDYKDDFIANAKKYVTTN